MFRDDPLRAKGPRMEFLYMSAEGAEAADGVAAFSQVVLSNVF
jgi:hypothetical protein